MTLLSNFNTGLTLYGVIRSDGEKEVLIEAYGTYSSSLDDELVQKYRINQDTQYGKYLAHKLILTDGRWRAIGHL